jgi:hypothetical protein
LREDLAGGERLFHLQAGRQLLVFDLDRGQAGRERFPILRGHEGDRFADVPDNALRKDGPVVLDHRDEVLSRDVGGGQHGVHAREVAGREHVEAGDARVRVGRAQDPRHERPRHRHVLDVEGAALHLVEGVGPADALADDHLRRCDLMGRRA